MPYAKLKSENYANVGGINQKASIYLTDDGEFLNLKNVDFRVVGSLSSFAGATQISTVGATTRITGIGEFVGSTGNQGISSQLISTTKNHICNSTGNTFQALIPFVYPGSSFIYQEPTSFVLADALYALNGFDFVRHNGLTTYQFSMVKPGVSSAISASSGAETGFSGILSLYAAFKRNDGFMGPAALATFSISGSTQIALTSTGRFNGNVNTLGTGLSSGSFGISGVQLWASVNNGPIYGRSGLVAVGVVGTTIGYDFRTLWGYQGELPDDYQGSFLFGLGSTQGSAGEALSIGYSSLSGPNPNIAEYFANRLFTTGFRGIVSGGFTSYPSKVVFSRPGEPEKADYENEFDVSPNDPNDISAMRTYFTTLGIWKPKSTWALSGTSIDTFVLTLVSDVYGCLSKRAVCVWEQNCWFLDRKGICEFNGANVKSISDKVQPIFERMNVSAAVTEAVMVHVKERNEVWCAIPIDGSSTNNIIVVWDYVAQAWTTRDCPPNLMAALSVLSLGNNKQTVYYGTYSGTIGVFGSSFIGNAGEGFTSVIKSKFFHPLGNSVTHFFRRLFLDCTIAPGLTYMIPVNFYANGGSTPVYQATMVLSDYQNRIDFGIPAKSMAVEFLYHGGTAPLQMNGFTIEYRFQRAV